jgi:hypothetical protein
MEWSDWIALAALFVAVASLVVTVIFNLAERRTREAEIALLDSQVALLRAQVEGEAAEREERRTAWIAAEQGSTSGGEQADEFTFHVTNLGPSVVWDVDLIVRTTTMNENEAMQDATPRVQVAPAMTVEQRRQVQVHVPRAFSRRRDLALWARWRDAAGDHEEALIPIKPLT